MKENDIKILETNKWKKNLINFCLKKKIKRKKQLKYYGKEKSKFK